MESLGKEHDLNHNVVNQGITVLGNKGATDQHSYIRQLLEILDDGCASNIVVEPNITTGDFLKDSIWAQSRLW